MARRFGFFQYIRLKVVATFLRLMVGRISGPRTAKDLARAVYQREIVYIPSRDPGRSIKAWLYSPPDSTASQTKKPILINWHGSGFVFASLGQDVAFCSHVARETGAMVLDADYRKGPEDPFPAAVHDVEDTLKWVASQPEQFDLDRIAVSGFSAGGTLALVAASSLRRQMPQIQIPIVVAIYPPTNLAADPTSKTVPNPKKAIPASVAAIFNECYLPEAAMRVEPRVSPLFADRAAFPATVAIFTCEGDTLAPEGIALAERLDDGQHKVININLKGTYHAFDKGCDPGTNEWEQREYMHKISVENLKEALGL